MSEAALAIIEPAEGASTLMRRATDVADVCRQIVKSTAMDLKGKKYVRVEGWQSIAAAYGCFPSIREVIEEERGVRAIAEMRRHDGVVIASAEGFVGLDEPTWASRAAYARRGMAQTRAISRVCRSVFAFVVVMIDSSLETTPAEEIPVAGEVVDAAPVHVGSRTAVRTVQASSSAAPDSLRDKSTQIKFGKSKGKYLCDVGDDEIAYHLAAAQKAVSANDPKWHEHNERWLAAVQHEADRRA